MSPPSYTISLTTISFLVGLGILPVFGRFSDKARLSLAKRKIRAALYAFRLFGDEPRLVFRAQGQLLLWNARYIGLMLRPVAILILPILLLLLPMDILYGHRPVHVGESTIVTARMANKIDLETNSPQLSGHGVTVETPPLRIPDEHQVLWKVRADRSGQNTLKLQVSQSGGAIESVQKTIRASAGLHYLAERRVASFLHWLRWPGESLLPANGPVRWIDVQYPDAEFRIFGIGMPWIVWFVIVSWTTMFALRKRFGVVI